MNSSLQLYNTSLNYNLSHNMCPLWPEIPALEAALVTPAAVKNGGIYESIKDHMPKTWDEAIPYFSKGFLLNECIMKRNPINCISILAARHLPSHGIDSQNAALARKYQEIPRYFVYKLELDRQYYWLLPCAIKLDGASCCKYFMYGVGSKALSLVEQEKMPTPLTVVNFLFEQAIYSKIVDTTISCVTRSWQECIMDGIKVLGCSAWIYYTKSEDR